MNNYDVSKRKLCSSVTDSTIQKTRQNAFNIILWRLLLNYFAARDHHAQDVVEEGQFCDAGERGPFWESDEKSKSSNFWQKSENIKSRVPTKHNVLPGGLDIGKCKIVSGGIYLNSNSCMLLRYLQNIFPSKIIWDFHP